MPSGSASLFSKFTSLFKLGEEGASSDPAHRDQVDWEDLERTLISADLGPNLASAVANRLRQDKKLSLHAALSELLVNKNRDLISATQKPTVILIVGVNGSGKTTSVGKLGALLASQGKSVVVVAADTFRAAARQQLETWAERSGLIAYGGKDGADPASVAFDGLCYGIERKADYVLIDTAGRLHTKEGLMDQLGKIRRVVEKRAPLSEVLLVLDGSTGQNALAQAENFTTAVEVTGLVLTKLDGSTRGGAALAIEQVLGIPIKYVGTGEGVGDFAPFAPEGYIAGLLSK
jgi:fused signal recognition particle receptor